MPYKQAAYGLFVADGPPGPPPETPPPAMRPMRFLANVAPGKEVSEKLGEAYRDLREKLPMPEGENLTQGMREQRIRISS